METTSILDTLARQIEAVKNSGGTEARAADDPAIVSSVLRSLRVTYLALSAGMNPWWDADRLFLLQASESGDVTLYQGGSVVPVQPGFLPYLFWTAGVELFPGQLVLLEPELAKVSIEDALGTIAIEQAIADRERGRQRALLESSLALPSRQDVDSIQALDDRLNQLWDRKIELVAAGLIADEYLERARAEGDIQVPDSSRSYPKV
jgi:hypothetical protein